VLGQRAAFCALPYGRSGFGLPEPSPQVTFVAHTRRFIRPVAVHLAKITAADASVQTSHRTDETSRASRMCIDPPAIKTLKLV
jgi:hypothetical protein